MKQTSGDDFDDRLDRVLREATTPREDPAFRARVVDALGRPKPLWRAPLLRLAVPAATVAALVVAVLAWTWWKPAPSVPVAQVVRQEPAQETPSRSADASGAATQASATRGPELGGAPGAQGSRVGRRLAGRDVRGMRQDVPDDGGSRIPRIVVPSLTVETITIEPLAATPEFAELDSPERVGIDPIAVEPLGPVR